MRNTPYRSYFYNFYKLLPLLAILTLPSGASRSCVSTFPKAESRVPTPNPLNDWLYRGAQPGESDFAMLKKKGIRTVVNFRNEPGWVEWERKKVEEAGMKYVSLPWSITRSVKPELLDDFFKVLDEPENRPVFFHCKHGRDRSGVMSVLALMRYEKMSEKEAREFTFETVRPHLRYLPFINQKIKFFLKSRPSDFPSDGA